MTRIGYRALTNWRRHRLLTALGSRLRRTGRVLKRIFWRPKPVIVAAVVAVWLLFSAAGVIGYHMIGLPDVRVLGAPAYRPQVTLLARDGSEIAAFGDQRGDWLRYRDIPAIMIQAVLATEDRRFFDHFGVDLRGLARASLRNMRAGEVIEGGSTITQQLAKNLFLTPDRTYRRKIQEMILAWRLERIFTKEELLSIYLNRVYLGDGTYGIDAAARRYFGHTARSLSLKEAALLAGLPKAPSRYAPTNNPDQALARMNEVIANLVETGYLTPQQAESYKGSLPVIAPQPYGGDALYFADWIGQRLWNYVNKAEEKLTVQTTFDAQLQRLAEAAVEDVMREKAAAMDAGEAALVAMTPDGAVRALVGGRNYGETQYSRATQALRQPGSAFKIFVYLAAVEAGYSPDDRIDDLPISIGKWSPANYRGQYRGRISLREAFQHSSNSVAVRLTEAIGRERVHEMARRLGISTPLTPHASIALGSSAVHLIELTGAYAILARNGISAQPHGILEVRGANGELLYRRTETPRRIVSQDSVACLNDMMISTVDEGTGRRAVLSHGVMAEDGTVEPVRRPVAGKTGTSQDFRDAWFIGYTGRLVTGVWVGNDDNSPMKEVTGGTLPADIFAAFMAPATADDPIVALPRTMPPDESRTAADDDGRKKCGFFRRVFGNRKDCR